MAAEGNLGFKVSTVAYFKRDNEMNVIVDDASKPKTLNGKHITFQELQKLEGLVPQDQCINLEEQDAEDNGKTENYLKSILNYISEEGFGGKTPQFVTNRQLLAEIATKPSIKSILVVKYKGVIFITFKKLDKERSDEEQAKLARGYKHGANFAHFLTKESESEEIQEDYGKSCCKAVMKCDIELEGKEVCVFYSAETDALEQGSNQHVELKAINYGTDNYNFWNLNSCPFYWKLFFGGCTTLLVGDKTRAETKQVEGNTEQVRDKATEEVRPKDPRDDYPPYSLCRIEQLEPEKIIGKYKQGYEEFVKRYNEWEKSYRDWEKRKEEWEWEQGLKEQEEFAKESGNFDKKSEEFEKAPEKPKLKNGKDDYWPKWSEEGGQNRVWRFLQAAEKKCLLFKEGVGFIGTEDKDNKIWNFEKVGRRHSEYNNVREFVDLVKKKMDIWKKNFPN
ncbi:unnamed protein product [Caenorhabditis nigoni]